MGAGNQARGLTIASKNRGWDPTDMCECNVDPGESHDHRKARLANPVPETPHPSPAGSITLRDIPVDNRGMHKNSAHNPIEDKVGAG